MRGMDAWEFLSMIFKKYDVEYNEFHFSDYFKGEYFSFADILNSIFNRKDTSKKELTLGHLSDVCFQGRWFEPKK